MTTDDSYEKQWDVFVSYASEDREAVAGPIAKTLQEHGLRVWFDQFEIGVGHSLSASINNGLAHSSYGIVVLSPAYLRKKWPQKELVALLSQQEVNSVRMLPVWHELGAEEINRSFPMLADIAAINTSVGLPEVINALLRAINVPYTGVGFSGLWIGTSGRLRLFQQGSQVTGDYDWNGHDWVGHVSGIVTVPPHVAEQDEGVLFTFNWWWDLSRERGNGFFIQNRSSDSIADLLRDFGVGIPYRAPSYRLEPRSFTIERDSRKLSGTWAFDHENLDLSGTQESLVSRRARIWSFRRVYEQIP